MLDLDVDSGLREFRDEIRDWLGRNVPDMPFPFPDTRQGVEAHVAWERKLFDAGLAAVHWPSEFGGRGMGRLETLLFYDEYVRAGAPPRFNREGLGLAGPTLIDAGTPEQKDRWLTRILSCEDLWCQGFSEPGAGSDLAAISTRGEIVDGGVLVNGQKVWTSHSEFAHWMFALVRTDPMSERHRGLTFLMIDMADAGIDVRPIRQINGGREFGEVFFTDVLVPDENVIGEVGQGWNVAMTTLTHERGAGLNTAAHFRAILEELIPLIPKDRRGDARIQEEIGWLHQQIEAYRYMTLRTASNVASGREAGPQAAMGKVTWSELQVRLFELGRLIAGPRAEVDDGADDGALPRNWRYRYWYSRAGLIYQGTNEIQRNIIAERVLGLPKELRGAL